MRHQVNDLFIKTRIKLELLDMLVIMETLKLYRSLKVTSQNLLKAQ